MTNFYKATGLSPVADHTTLTVPRSHRPKTWMAFSKPQTAERRPQTADRRTQNAREADRRTQNAERRTQNAREAELTNQTL